MHRACAALSMITAFFRSGQCYGFAETIQQCGPRVDSQRMVLTINAKGDRNCTFNGRHSCVGRRRVRGRICGGVCREHTGSHCAGCPQEFASVRLFRSREMIVICHWVDPTKVNSDATTAQVSDNGAVRYCRGDRWGEILRPEPEQVNESGHSGEVPTNPLAINHD